MNSLHESADFRFRNVLGLNGVVQMHRDRRRPQQPAAFAIKLERTADAHRHDGSADLMCHHEGTLLKRSYSAVQRSRTLSKDNDANAFGEMRTDVLQGFLELRRPAAAADRDIAKSFHHPAVSWDLEADAQFVADFQVVCKQAQTT